jgi:AcrR family transcriptional regulator
MVIAVGARELGKAERRRRIKDAALEVFLERGYAAATTREIARRAGVAQGTLFLYVRDKRDLVLMLFNDDLDVLTSSSFGSVDRDAPLLDQLLYVFRPRYEYWGRYPDLSRQALTNVAQAEPEQASRQASRYAFRRGTMLATIADIIRDAQTRGRARTEEDATQMAWVLLSLYRAMIRLWLSDPEPNVNRGIDELRRTLRLAIRGIDPNYN